MTINWGWFAIFCIFVICLIVIQCLERKAQREKEERMKECIKCEWLIKCMKEKHFICRK